MERHNHDPSSSLAENRLTRRSFLEFLGGAIATAGLAACGQESTPGPTQTVEAPSTSPSTSPSESKTPTEVPRINEVETRPWTGLNILEEASLEGDPGIKWSMVREFMVKNNPGEKFSAFGPAKPHERHVDVMTMLATLSDLVNDHRTFPDTPEGTERVLNMVSTALDTMTISTGVDKQNEAHAILYEAFKASRKMFSNDAPGGCDDTCYAQRYDYRIGEYISETSKAYSGKFGGAAGVKAAVSAISVLRATKDNAPKPRSPEESILTLVFVTPENTQPFDPDFHDKDPKKFYRYCENGLIARVYIGSGSHPDDGILFNADSSKVDPRMLVGIAK